MTGCYEDKGNYDYTLDTMNNITSVTFTPSLAETAEGFVIEVQQALSEEDNVRRVKANVEQTLATDLEDLDFYWYRSYKDNEGKLVKDTIESRGYLELDLEEGKEYDVFLKIYDRTTSVSHYSAFKIKTRPLFKNSLFVLHGKEGDRKIGNIEVIGNDTKIYTDVKTATKDNNNYENATGLWFSTYFDIPDDLSRGDITRNLTVFGNNGETRTYDPYGMKMKYTAAQTLKPESETFSYKKTIQAGDPSNNLQYKIAISDNGEAYIGNYTCALYKPGSGCGNRVGCLHDSNYAITAATITYKHFLMWDENNKRFLYINREDAGFGNNESSSIRSSATSVNSLLDAHVDFETLIKSPADMKGILGYINYRDNYENNKPYFIFKDEASGEYYRYELLDLSGAKNENSGSDSGSDSGDNKKVAYTISGEKKLTNFTPSDDNCIIYNSHFTTANLFFVEGSTVYRYTDNGSKYVVYEAPVGYDITKIKFRTEDSCSFSADLGLYLNIVMFNGSNGAIGEIKLNTASDIDTSYAPKFYDKDNEGNLWGEIKDIQFVHDYLYSKN